MNETGTATRSASRGQRSVGAVIAIAVFVGTLAGLVTANAADAATNGGTKITDGVGRALIVNDETEPAQ